MTVDWYRQFGDTWWGDISPVLTAYPVLEGDSHVLVSEGQHGLEASVDRMPLSRDVRNEVVPPAAEKKVNSQSSETMLPRKRMRASSPEVVIRNDVRVA